MGINDPEYLRLKALVDRELPIHLQLAGKESATLRDAMKYSLDAGGKRIRPVLLLSAAAAGGADIDVALPFAVSCEYIQTYSLIHDDLPGMDDDDLRRGKPTNHKVFGVGMAILAGDGLLSLAHEIMYGEMEKSFGDEAALERKVKAAKALAEGTGCLGMVAGQCADLEAENKVPDEEDLNFIHRHKTGSFIKASVMCGAYLGGADPELLSLMEGYGDALGLAFQVVDDIEDVVSTPEERGKAVGGDSRNGKLTYPALYGLEASVHKAMELIEKASSFALAMGEKGGIFLAIAAYLKDTIKGLYY